MELRLSQSEIHNLALAGITPISNVTLQNVLFVVKNHWNMDMLMKIKFNVTFK